MAPKPLTRRLIIILLTAVAMLVSYATVTPLVPNAHAASPLISQGKVVHFGLSEPGLETVRRAPYTRFTEDDFRANVPRNSPENLAANMPLVQLIQEWGVRKGATLA